MHIHYFLINNTMKQAEPVTGWFWYISWFLQVWKHLQACYQKVYTMGFNKPNIN